MKETMKIWAVYTTDDLTEGRSGQYIKHLCATEATARRLAKGQYVQGTDCPVSAITLPNIDGKPVIHVSRLKVIHPSREDVSAQERLDTVNAIREKALAAGLTDDDINQLRMIRP